MMDIILTFIFGLSGLLLAIFSLIFIFMYPVAFFGVLFIFSLFYCLYGIGESFRE